MLGQPVKLRQDQAVDFQGIRAGNGAATALYPLNIRSELYLGAQLRGNQGPVGVVLQKDVELGTPRNAPWRAR